MTFGEAIRSVFSKYATFSGRARRSEYWWFYLFVVLLGIAAGTLDAIFFTSSATAGAPASSNGPIAAIAQLALFLPQLAVTVRRLHDTGRSGWLLGGFVLYVVAAVAVVVVLSMSATPAGGTPDFSGATGIVAIVLLLGVIAYGIYLFVLMLLDSTPGDNAYGVDPKGPRALVGGD